MKKIIRLICGFLKNNWLPIIIIIFLIVIYQKVNLTVDYADTANANAKKAYYSASDAASYCNDAESSCSDAMSYCDDAQSSCNECGY